MIRRPPRSTLSSSSAASDVYKRQGHPYHHIGMPGTVMLRESVVEETLVDVMLGLWNDGFRKMIIVNNHGHLWMLETALHKFLKRYQVPAIVRVIDWHRSVKDFFRT